MTVAAFLLIAVAVVAMVVFLRREVNRAVARLEADIRGRQKLLDDQQRLLYKQAKSATKRDGQITGAADRAVARANDLIAKNRDLHVQVQQILCDPKIQGALRRAEEVEPSGR